MIHTRTVQGLPWQCCAVCPHPTPNACPSRAHPAYCANLRANPELWGPIIREMPPEDRPAREGPPPRAVNLTEEELAAIAQRKEAEWAAQAAIAAELQASMAASDDGEESEPPLPSIATMARSLLKTGAAVARHLLTTGEVLAPDSLRDARLRVCEAGEGLSPDQVRSGHCDHYKPSKGRCAGMEGCGCYVAMKAALLATECPLGRWPVEATSGEH